MYFLLLAVLPVARADFAVIGDWGRGGTDIQMRMAATFDKMKPDFVISTGDNFYLDGISSVTDIKSFQWAQTYNTDVPWYLVLGNHDYYGNAAAQIELTDVYTHWNMPSRYFNKRIGDIEFWFLDTTPWLEYNPVHKDKLEAWQRLEIQREKIPEQYGWLQTTLAASDAPRKIFVGHHPLWTFGEHVDEANDEMRAYLTELMAQYKVESYLCGHDHNLQYVSSGGLHEFISGGGAWKYDWDWFLGSRSMDDAELKYGSSEYGFLWVSGHTYSFYDMDGLLLHEINLSEGMKIHDVDRYFS